MGSILSFVQANALLVSTCILILAYIFIAAEKLPKVTIALSGATLTLLFGLLGQNQKVDGVLDKFYFINYVDWNVISNQDIDFAYIKSIPLLFLFNYKS